MVRIVKEHDERKAEILEAAQALFFQEGYENTPVSAIIDKVGVAKGTFYYYFKSKEDLLDALAEKASEDSVSLMNGVVEESGLSALEKLNKIYSSTRNWQAENMGLVMTILKAMYQDENLLLRNKIQVRSLEMSVPIFAKVIEQGVKEGVFDAENPEDIGEMVLRLGNDLGDSTVNLFLEIPAKQENLELLENKIAAYQQAVERILGAPKDSIQILDRAYIRQYAEKYFGSKDPKNEELSKTGNLG